WLNCGRHISLAAARRAPQNRAGGRAAIANPSTALPPIAAVCAGTLGTVMDDHLAKPFRSDHLLAVEPAATPDGRVCFDRALALARVMNSEALLANLVRTFQASLPGLRAELAAAVAQRDADATFRAAHALKGSAATFAA